MRLVNPFSPSLPLDARTLLDTNRDNVCVDMGDGKFVYFGMNRFMDSEVDVDQYELSVNIDGLPLFKSSKTQFWPIQGTFNGSDPFIIALYCGTEKPDVNLLLEDFIKEVHSFGNRIKIKSIICDSPARAMIKCIKYPSGYSSCDKCTINGEYSGKVVFTEMECSLRTYVSFRNQTDIEHHKGESPLVSLPIDMVDDIPYDYMHSVCLGVMKRLIFFWMCGSVLTKLTPTLINLVNQKLFLFSMCFPLDFSRKPREISLFKYWKATEFRSFLLFTGPVVLKDVLSDAAYKNFLLLHSAIYTLCDPLTYLENIPFTNECLHLFVKSCRSVYGKSMLVYNVHSLLHLSSDCIKHGHLDNFSAFKFENNMSHIKRKIRNHRLPLQQMINRMSESTAVFTYSLKTPCFIAKYEHSNGPLLSNNNVQQFKVYASHITRFSIFRSDRYFISEDKHFYEICNIVLLNDTIFFVSKQFANIRPLYVYPINSLQLNIAVSSGFMDDLVAVPFTSVFRKCCCIKNDEDYILVPLFINLH